MRLAAPVRSALAPLVFGLIGLGLTGCARTTDNFTPRVVISSPSDGGVSKTKTPLVMGYALDDVGVTKITVDGKSVPIKAGSRKIAKFQFQAEVKGNAAEYQIAAYDAAGHKGTLSLPIVVDNTPPEIHVKSFERAGRIIRVSGLVTDNNQVAQVIVDGNRLNIQPGKRVDFYAQTTGIYADIEVYDAAGNRATVRAQ